MGAAETSINALQLQALLRYVAKCECMHAVLSYICCMPYASNTTWCEAVKASPKVTCHADVLVNI